ncbi:aspartic peptidase A1 [Pseudomassariella vexata]|uniref:Aspartic peptidase A1 n=1 Tax=Pseudomassariella vexata TaxID=1141098 RepID=A0A1Y2DDF5_9PEZI|nr:aspartic peptidase A1 [Pseudomassariella vexata]ORY57290.1 aspartic peptidase A1 [Pseudomassariella vexata]
MEAIFAAQNKLKASRNLSKIKVVYNKNYQRHGTKSYVYLLNRFGFEPTKPGPYYHAKQVNQRGLAGSNKAVGGRLRTDHVLVKKVDADGNTGQVTAEDQQNDSMYLSEVTIGTPPQKLMLDFDTGSADLWVFSTGLKNPGSGHNVFDSSKSSTWKALSNETWKIQYGDGSTASGTCGTDTLTVGGLSVEKQVIEEATQMSDQFAQGSGDGLLGLAFGAINTVMKNGKSHPVATPVENMISQQDIPKEAELFTSAFYSDRDGASAAESFYTFGFIDQDLVTKSGQEISWVDIDNSQGFWQFPSTSYSINGKSTTVSGNTAIADTGTSLALVSDQVCEALYKAIPGAKYDETNQGYVFPKDAKMPKFSVAVGDKEFVISGPDLAFADLGDGSNNVYGGVQSRGSLDFDILGDSFLKNVYAIWDQGNKRFGVVPKI